MLRILAGFDQASLKTLVTLIASKTDLLLEVVNYNVEQQQYVCAGHVSEKSIIATLASVINSFSRFKPSGSWGKHATSSRRAQGGTLMTERPSLTRCFS